MRDSAAGMVTAVVLVANTVGFAALMLPGALASGVPIVIWAMLVGSAITGIWLASRTSLPPMATGMDSPTGAVFVLLSASAAPSVLTAGAGIDAAVQVVLLLFSLATVVTGAVLLALGAARRGALLRFVPYFVVAGFLAATGWLLIVGGVRMVTGHDASTLFGEWTPTQGVRLACAVLSFGLLIALRRWVRWPLAMPSAVLVLVLGGETVLHALDLSDASHGWYLPSLGTLASWSPWRGLDLPASTFSTIVKFLPETVAVALVALVSMVTKVSSLEVARKRSADLDQDLRANGVGMLVAAPFGGIAASIQLGSSRLLENAGGATRFSGVASSVVLGVIALANIDLPSMIPLPVAAGLVFFLGWGFLVESLAKPLAQRAWRQIVLALVIATACVRYGYLVGVISGIVAASLMFALSYARVGVVRRHLSRAQFSGHVVRPAEASRHLFESGEAIQIYWLNGYLFFGSSESVFERLRADLCARPPGAVRYVVLDFSMVTGADTSATLSLAKMRELCRQRGIALVFAGLDEGLQRVMSREKLFTSAAPFDDVNAALAWCEDQELERAGIETVDAADPAQFAAWLERELKAPVADLLGFFDRREIPGPQVLYREGEPADTIDLVAAGRLAIEITPSPGRTLRVRSITTLTVVGEMGFFRRVPRSATVSCEGPATLYTLTRAAYERLRRDRPDVAGAFDEFILRTLADRMALSERTLAALSR